MNTGTPVASTVPLVIRLQRFADALSRDDTAWARGYLDRRALPELANHPNGAATWAYCLRALGSDVESLVQDPRPKNDLQGLSYEASFIDTRE